MRQFLFIIGFVCTFSFSFSQPHPYGCQHWRKLGGQTLIPNQVDSRSLNESILRSDTFDILHYDISIDITDYAGQTIKAETQIQFVPKMNAQQSIRFDLVRLTVDSVKNQNNLLPFETDSQFVTIHLANTLSLNDTTTLTLYYHGHPYRDPVWGGFYFESGYIYNLGIGLSTIPPNFGKVWYPCFDSFVERATYRYHVKSSGAFKAHCQGTFEGETNVGGDTVIRSYSFNQPLPTHLSAFAASDYRDLTYVHQGNYAPVPVKLTAKPADTSAMRTKFLNLGNAINACENWYGPTGWPGVGYALTTDGALEITGNVAYPQFMMGQAELENRNLFAHELGHYWWGNWIAPYNHNDMWLKEGPAEYSAHLTVEEVDGHDAFINEVKDNHEYVLKTAHITDNGYFALSPMPDDNIYGDHTYYKGASVMHNLRGYLGDDLFRQAMSAVQAAHPYETITPFQLRDYLEAASGFDLHDFFEDQVYKPGFSVFVVDSFASTQSGANWNSTIHIQQKLRKCPSFYGDVPLDLTLIGANRQSQDVRITANGQYSNVNITSSFEPKMVILNRHTRLNQARTDYENTFVPDESILNGILPYSEMRLYLDTLTDSTLVRIDHIWAAPDSSLRSEDIYQFSANHYWHVDGIWPATTEMHAQLNYVGNTSESLDNDLFDNTEAQAVLIYRENASAQWKVYTDFTLNAGSITNGIGSMKISQLRKGDYAFANGNILANINPEKGNSASIKIYPNPSNQLLKISIDNKQNEKLIYSIYSVDGRLCLQANLNSNAEFSLDVSKLNNGTYILNIQNLDGRHIEGKVFQVIH